jgi:hypothetical protein
MVRKRVYSRALVTGLAIIVAGAALAICSAPVFTFTRDEVRLVPRSEIIMNYSFNLHQLQDKIVQFQASIGQELDIFVMSDGIFNFSIANFTDPSHIAEPDQPDVTYLSMNNTSYVNTTWSPTIRLAQPRIYYLIFLARNASSDSPVHVLANVTKTWTDVQTYGVPYQKALIDSSFAYVGLGIFLFGAAISYVALHRQHKPRRHIRTS